MCVRCHGLYRINEYYDPCAKDGRYPLEHLSHFKLFVISDSLHPTCSSSSLHRISSTTKELLMPKTWKSESIYPFPLSFLSLCHQSSLQNTSWIFLLPSISTVSIIIYLLNKSNICMISLSYFHLSLPQAVRQVS